MPWYCGQDGAARLRWRDKSSAALSRFRRSLPPNTKLTNLVSNVVDNSSPEVSKLIIYNPTEQDDLIASIRKEAPPAGDEDAEGSGWAVAIAASDKLKQISLLNDVADKITGLFIYCVREVPAEDWIDFFSKLTNLESLTIVDFTDICKAKDYSILKTAFERGYLPKLKFLETSNANDDMIASMTTSPIITEIVFTAPHAGITNEGFQRLVDAGGAKELMKISAGTLKKHLSKTLTSKYMASTLPKLSGMGEYMALTHFTGMAQGNKKKSAHERMMAKYAEHDNKPFAIIPPERMKYGQLEVSLRHRGKSLKGVKGASGGRPKTEDLRRILVEEVGWSVESERDIQNRLKLEKLQKDLETLRTRAAYADKDVKSLLSKKHVGTDKLYPLLGQYEIQSALRDNDVPYYTKTCKRRDDQALVLHKSGYQGGGNYEAQLKHHRSVSAEKNEDVQKKLGEIEALRREIALREHKPAFNGGCPEAAAASGAGSIKRAFAQMSK